MLLNSLKRPTDGLYVEPRTILLREFGAPSLLLHWCGSGSGGNTVSAEEAGLLLVAEGLCCHDALPDMPRCQQRETEQINEWTK